MRTVDQICNSRSYKLVSWSEHKRIGKFVQMIRGTDKKGWWHLHMEKDAGDHPMDYDRKLKTYICRDCGVPYNG